jgi:3-oxoacyl-[acyl-carrier protein] reductase
MTEGVFAESPSEEGDPVGPEHVARLVAYLAGDASDHITGQVFRVRGGTIELYEGWRAVSAIEDVHGWTVSALTEAIPRLFGNRPPAYAPPMIPGQPATPPTSSR